MPGFADGAQFLPQPVGIAVLRRSPFPDIQHAGRHDGGIGQRPEAVPDIADGGHGKGPPQDGGASAGIKGGDDVDCGNGKGGKMAAQGSQRRAACKEYQRRDAVFPKRRPVHAATLPGTSPSSSIRR